MKIAVTAASGQLGRAVISRLKENHPASDICGIARSPEKAADLGVTIRQGNYGDRGAFARAFDGIDAVLLISSNAPPDDRLDQHRSVIEGAQAAGVRRIVYTSVQGPEDGTGFANVVNSNRASEADIRACGLEWVIGRNGIYIEPDVEYLDSYKAAGAIRNCAGDGKCAYVTRSELAFAYAHLLTASGHSGQTYNLSGDAITQSDLAKLLNGAFDIDLRYEFVDADTFKEERVAEIGEFYGMIVAGIYEAISKGAFDNHGDFEAACGRPHVSWPSYFSGLAR